MRWVWACSTSRICDNAMRERLKEEVSMWQAWLVVLSALVLVGLSRRVYGRLIRYRALQRLPVSERLRAAHGVGLRVLVEGSTALAGMKRGRSNRTHGDLVVTRERVLLVCNRGVLLDRRRQDGGPLWEVRCTGPGRLVLECLISQNKGRRSSFRVDFSELDKAADWASLLQGYGAEKREPAT